MHHNNLKQMFFFFHTTAYLRVIAFLDENLKLIAYFFKNVKIKGIKYIIFK